MYNLPPPKCALEWPLGLVMDICLKAGLGKQNTQTDSWTESEVAEILSVSQIRHWYEQPPGASSEIIRRFVDFITHQEPHAKAWALVIRHSASKSGNRAEARLKYFGVSRFGKKTREDIILPALIEMPLIHKEEIEKTLSPRLSPNLVVKPENWYHNITLIAKTYRIQTLTLITAAFIGATYLTVGMTNQKHQFGKVFSNIQFCLDKNFADLPENKCLSDTREFTTDHRKINLSFERIAQIDPGSSFTLQWLRNGEKKLEKARPWREAFALDFTYASTHIKMKKFDFLPPDWADPGRYHVRFFVNKKLVDEARFDVKEASQ